MSTTAILLLSCADQPGLVAAVADFIYRHRGNILHADQHTDQSTGVFVQRVEFDLEGFALPRDEIADAFRPIAERFSMQWALRFSDERSRIAILVSREPHCLYDLLARHRMGELPADIAVVVSNHPDHDEGTRSFGVPYVHLPIVGGDKAGQERRLDEVLTAHDVDLVVLARYMQILSPAFVDRWERRIINIHHSFLPAFAGARPYHQAHERGVKVIGATAHYVTADLDQGPIIEQDVTRVSHRDDVRDLVQKGRDLEKVVLARAVRLHLEHRVIVIDDKTVVFD